MLEVDASRHDDEIRQIKQFWAEKPVLQSVYREFYGLIRKRMQVGNALQSIVDIGSESELSKTSSRMLSQKTCSLIKALTKCKTFTRSLFQISPLIMLSCLMSGIIWKNQRPLGGNVRES
jgi:hypothetical protein